MVWGKMELGNVKGGKMEWGKIKWGKMKCGLSGTLLFFPLKIFSAKEVLY